jgi:hypothetical protein
MYEPGAFHPFTRVVLAVHECQNVGPGTHPKLMTALLSPSPETLVGLHSPLGLAPVKDRRVERKQGSDGGGTGARQGAADSFAGTEHGHGHPFRTNAGKGPGGSS